MKKKQQEAIRSDSFTIVFFFELVRSKIIPKVMISIKKIGYLNTDVIRIN